MPLGVAEDAAKLVAFAHARGEPSIAMHLRDCRRKGAYDTAFELREIDARLVMLDAAGRSTLACASSALDFAVVAAARRGIGITLTARARERFALLLCKSPTSEKTSSKKCPTVRGNP